MTVDPALSSASSGLLMSTSASTSTFAPQTITSAPFPYSNLQQRQYQQQQQAGASSSVSLSSPQLIVARLLELERSLQFLSTTAYCHPILVTGLSSQFYVIKYAMHALSAEEKKLAAWQQRRQQRAVERRQRRARVKQEAAVKTEEDEASGMSMRGEGEADPGLSMMVGTLHSHDADEATVEQELEEEERRQSEMHELRVNKAELRHVGEWINAQLAALHSQVQAQLAHYPSPPSSPPPPPPSSASTGSASRSTQPYMSTHHVSDSSSSSDAQFGGSGSSSFSFHSFPLYPTASTTSTGSAYPTYSAPTTHSFPPPPLDERSVSTGSRSSQSSPITPPPVTQPPPLFSSQSLPVWSSSAGNLSPLDHSAVYRKINDRPDLLEKSYIGSADMVEAQYGAAPLGTAHFSSLPAAARSSTHPARSEHFAHHPPHPASSQSLGVATHPSTLSRVAATMMHPAHTSHSFHHDTAFDAEGDRKGRQRPHSHSDGVGPSDWQPQQQQLAQHEQQSSHRAAARERQYNTANTGDEDREGSETGRQRKRASSRRRKRDSNNSEDAATVYAFPRAPHSIFPKLPSAADNPHERR